MPKHSTAAASLMPYKNVYVVGGRSVNDGEWPWLAHFVGELGCTASIIAPRYLLTAAHCASYENPEPTWRYVEVGSVDYDEAPRIKVKKAHVHPQWKHTESGPVTTLLQNDIAIVELYKPLNFTEKVRPICLPLEYREVPGEEGIVAGFGRHDVRHSGGSVTYESDSLLRDAKVTLHAYKNCHFSNLDESGDNLTDPIAHPENVVCVGAKGRGNQIGESGGPLMVSTGDAWFTVGIVSWANANHSLEQDKYPSTYTRVTSYCDWIADVTGGEAKCRSFSKKV
ncbi:serine protease [Aphelenchoides avenae]|nr:serine protease [Aphelenchus avenae]